MEGREEECPSWSFRDRISHQIPSIDSGEVHDVIPKARDLQQLCQLNRFQQMAQKLSLQARRWRTIIVTLPVMAATSRS